MPSSDPNASGTGVRGWPNDYIAAGVCAGMKPTLSNLPADAQQTVNSPAQSIAFNATPPLPQPIAVNGASGSTADPNSDGLRRANGVVAGVVFGN